MHMTRLPFSVHNKAHSESLVLNLLLVSLSVSFTTLLMACLVLLVFRIESHLRKRNESLDVSVQ